MQTLNGVVHWEVRGRVFCRAPGPVALCMLLVSAVLLLVVALCHWPWTHCFHTGAAAALAQVLVTATLCRCR